MSIETIPNGRPQSSIEAVEPSPVYRALALVQGAAADLDTAIGELHVRVQPILGPTSTPTLEEAPEQPESASDVTASIYALAAELRLMRGRVRDMLARLEV